MASKLSIFLSELKRRKVYHVGAAYVVVGSSVVVGAHFLLVELLGLGNLAAQTVGALIVLGFPIALVLAWAYEVKPEDKRQLSPVPVAWPLEEKTSIVVLPFDNHSPDPGDAYFADGLTEEIITELSFMRTLRVISRSSAMALKGTHKDVCTIGRELNVQYVLEGSVRKVGNNLRITAQLIDAGTDTHLWAEKHDGVLDEVFAMQEKVARSIVEALSIQITPEESRRISKRPIEDVRAYQAYLRARQGWWTEEGTDQALRDAQYGLELVGENAYLLEVIGVCHWSRFNQHLSADPADLDDAEEIARRIFQLDSESPHGNRLMGMVLYKRGAMAEAIRHMEIAREHDPTNPYTLNFLNYWYGDVGRVNEMSPLVKQMTRDDPLDLMSWWSAGWHELLRGRYAQAVEAFERMAGLATENPFAKFAVGHALAHAGRGDDARKILLSAQMGDTPWGWVGSLLAGSLDQYGSLPEPPGEDARARVWTDEYLSWIVAEAYGRAGCGDEALRWLGRAMELGFVNHPFVSDHDRFFDPIRSEPRFRRLLDEMENRWQVHQPART